jgi:hypothetical protein
MKTLMLAFAALTFTLVSWTQPVSVEKSEHRTSSDSPSGRVYGPADVSRRVSAYSTYTDQILFRGSEVARIVIEGDGDCDLDLYVYNDDGVLVAKDDDYTDYCTVSWVPNYTKSYRIVVKNRGSVYADYRLRTN